MRLRNVTRGFVAGLFLMLIFSAMVLGTDFPWVEESNTLELKTSVQDPVPVDEPFSLSVITQKPYEESQDKFNLLFYINGTTKIDYTTFITFDSAENNSTMLGSIASMSSLWVFNGSLDSYIFEWNFSGFMTADSSVQFREQSPSPLRMNISRTLGTDTSMWHKIIYWRVNATDEFGHQATTGIQTFNITAIRAEHVVPNTGSLRLNSTIIPNGTITFYMFPTILITDVLPNRTYGFDKVTEIGHIGAAYWESDYYVNPSTINFTLLLSLHDDWITVITVYFTAPGGESTPYIVSAFDWSPAHPDNSQVITFDGSHSGSSASITEYSWNFGDGNITEGAYESITHYYDTNGTKTVSLTVTSSVGESSLSEFIVVGYPTDSWIQAVFIWDPPHPDNSAGILFNASSCSSHAPITEYSWNFGDGNITAGAYQTITHSYPVNDTYMVSLTITSADGSSAITEAVVVGYTTTSYVYGIFTWDPAHPETETVGVAFDGSLSQSSSEITEYSWDFGDGNVTAGAYVTIDHTFAANGTYAVELTVSSDVGEAAFSAPVVIGGGGSVIEDFTGGSDLAAAVIISLILIPMGILLIWSIFRRR